jgi:hypothetical protein
MSDDFTVMESRMQSDGSVRYLVHAPGGMIVVDEDASGNLSARFRSGYVATDEAEEDPLGCSLEAVRQLHRDSSQELTTAKREEL